MTNWKHWLVAFSGVFWLLAIGAGFKVLLSYSNTAGASAHAPVEWPAASEVRPSGDIPTLVMIAHPRCPCTRASINELSILMSRCQGKVAAAVLFIRPEGLPADWEQTDLLRGAAAIPGVTVLADPGGVEAARFGAETSGQVVLYDHKGRLIFEGGITAARGHEGDNDGRSAIVSLLDSGGAYRSMTPVFGCPINNDGSKCPMEVVNANAHK